jgi:hypothetical protein
LPNAQTDSTVFIGSFLRSLLEFTSAPSLSRYDDWVTAAAAVAPRQVPRSSSGPLPPTSINPVCPPFICPSCRAKPITQTLPYAIWLFVLGSGLITNMYMYFSY